MILSFQQQQVDSNVRALKNEIAQLRRLVADLRGELGEVLTRQNDIERTFEERLNHHREDLDWDREECILLRTGLLKFSVLANHVVDHVIVGIFVSS